MSQYMIEEIDRCLCVCFDRFLMHFYLLSIQYYLLRYVGCWIIDFDQETKIHTVSSSTYGFVNLIILFLMSNFVLFLYLSAAVY